MLLPVVRQREQAAYKLSDKLTKRCAILQNDEKWQKLSLPCGRASKSIHTVYSPGKMPERKKEELF